MFQLLSQIAYVDVNDVAAGPEVETPDGVEQLLAAKDLSGVSHEVLKQVELLRRRREQLSARRTSRVARSITTSA